MVEYFFGKWQSFFCKTVSYLPQKSADQILRFVESRIVKKLPFWHENLLTLEKHFMKTSCVI